MRSSGNGGFIKDWLSGIGASASPSLKLRRMESRPPFLVHCGWGFANNRSLFEEGLPNFRGPMFEMVKERIVELNDKLSHLRRYL
ncbi:MAG: hypothetical protein M2R45_03929 [Verrucomicrobia subdivision 3 bacterium]|nr:hypothetical protein [Limisphaerales bacterium]MCS1417491.1 hypothetical protein [Limisphaerales bacterium]